MATLFKDLQKRSSDLLTKEYPSDKSEIKAEWKSKTLSGIEIESTTTRDRNGNLVANLKEKYNIPEYNADVSAELNTNKDAKLEFSFKDSLVQGLKTTAAGHSQNANAFTALSAEYKHPHFTFNGAVDYGKPSDSTLEGSATSQFSGAALGISAKWSLANQRLSSFKTILAYNTLEFDTALYGSVEATKDGSSTKNVVGASYFHSINSLLKAGGDISVDTSAPSQRPLLTWGVSYQLTSDSTVKAKLDSVGKLGLSLSQQLNRTTKLVVGTTVDTNNLSGKNTSTFGMHLTFTQ
jgi:hypothetical protein